MAETFNMAASKLAHWPNQMQKKPAYSLLLPISIYPSIHPSIYVYILSYLYLYLYIYTSIHPSPPDFPPNLLEKSIPNRLVPTLHRFQLGRFNPKTPVASPGPVGSRGFGWSEEFFAKNMCTTEAANIGTMYICLNFDIFGIDA